MLVTVEERDGVQDQAEEEDGQGEDGGGGLDGAGDQHRPKGPRRPGLTDEEQAEGEDARLVHLDLQQPVPPAGDPHVRHPLDLPQRGGEVLVHLLAERLDGVG